MLGFSVGDKKKEIIIDTAVFSSGLQAGNGVWEHGAPEQQLPFFFFFLTLISSAHQVITMRRESVPLG